MRIPCHTNGCTDLKFSSRHECSVTSRHFTDLEVCKNMDAWLPDFIAKRPMYGPFLTAGNTYFYNSVHSYLCKALTTRRRKLVYSFVVTGGTAALSTVKLGRTPAGIIHFVQIVVCRLKTMRHFSFC